MTKKARSPAASAVTRRVPRLALPPRPISMRKTSIPRITDSRAAANVTWHFLPRCARLLHVVAGLPAGRFQPQLRLLHPGRAGDRAVLLTARICLRQSDQQRDRLEDRILRPPPAVERCRLPRRLEQRAGRLLRSGRPRECGLRYQWTELPHSRRGDLLRRRAHRGLTAQGGAVLEHQQADQLALSDREQSRPARQIRRRKAEYGQPIYDVDNPYGPAGGPSANSPPLQFNVRCATSGR